MTGERGGQPASPFLRVRLQRYAHGFWIQIRYRQWQNHGGIHGHRHKGTQHINIFTLARGEYAEGKVFQSGIKIMIHCLPALEEDRVIVAESELLREMMNTKTEAGRGKIPAIVEPVEARTKLAHMYLVGKGVVGENDCKGDNRTGLPVSDKIFYHTALLGV